jgi:hypothetical protein
MIILEQADYMDYFKNMMSLFYFAGVSEGKIPPMEFNQFLEKCANMPTLHKCRNLLIKKPRLTPEFLTLNRHLLPPGDVKIIKDFIRRKTSKFIVVRYEPDYAVFVDTKDAKIYAVKALTEPFSAILPPLPVCMEASILPFKNMIVYDGMAHVSTSKINDKEELIQASDEQIKKAGIIRSF